jgi:hypothetical protein
MIKQRKMGGLARLCRMYGQMNINGVIWIWDYVNEEPRIKSEMTKEEIAESEKTKWNLIKKL